MAQAQLGLPSPFAQPPVGPCPDSDFDSDSEDATAGGAGPGAGLQNPSQVIHSGHFMVSSPHRDALPHRRQRRAEPSACCIAVSIDLSLSSHIDILSSIFSTVLF